MILNVLEDEKTYYKMFREGLYIGNDKSVSHIKLVKYMALSHVAKPQHQRLFLQSSSPLHTEAMLSKGRERSVQEILRHDLIGVSPLFEGGAPTNGKKNHLMQYLEKQRCNY